MKLMIMLNMSMNIMFIIMKHPLSMGLMIILQTTIISMMTGMMFKSFWFSYILFLMYVGGMMVLFIYMTSLMPNMMFSLSNKNIIIMILSIMIMIMIEKKNLMMNSDMMMMINKQAMLMKMYNYPMNMLVITTVLYLLFTMITVFKITELNSGPLRMTFN
uniref:NADH dehydrogenase subunit 6 n=1 Tax=Lopaphus sphalerus TaxID=202369 RepID=UPI0025A9C801|nr:NADH dehydrogenase subunit 6 [Lopaphus sphalerus]WID87065.1 NADH dehydrogenase subunit 6 [Lopaphus sphalerus]